MLAYHMLSPALSVEETGLMAYLQAPPEAGPSIVQVTSGLQNWKCAGRRLVEIGGRLPTATQLHQSFIKILSTAFGSKQEVELHVSTAVKHHSHDESKSYGDCGTLFVCRGHTDTICYCSGTFPGGNCFVS